MGRPIAGGAGSVLENVMQPVQLFLRSDVFRRAHASWSGVESIVSSGSLLREVGLQFCHIGQCSRDALVREKPTRERVRDSNILFLIFCGSAR
jgi:hypothetical protein